MNLQPAPTHITGSDERLYEARRHLHGRRLVFVRILCLVLVAYTLAFFGTSLVLAFAEHQAICTGLTCVLPIPEALVYFAVATLIFWRKSGDWMAQGIALMLILLAPISTLPDEILNLLSSISGMHILLSVSIYLAFASLLLFWFLFPNGRFWPRWTPWVVVGYLVWPANFFFFFPGDSSGGWFLLDILLLACLLIIIVFVQVIRYQMVSTSVERQQTKWAIAGASVAVWGGFVYYLHYWTTPRPLLLLIPLSIGIAVLRYRLYEIDVLINRTLIYGTLTAVLALVYFGLVYVLQLLFRGLIGQTNDLAIVIATLVIAALFHSLRRRIQSVIDRRFYRRKYDAAKVVATFSATLRQEVDLDQLREHLLAVVLETMQPSHISLWLRLPAHDETQRAPWRTTPLGSSEEG